VSIETPVTKAMIGCAEALEVVKFRMKNFIAAIPETVA
jgi:hypothetical protein